MPQNKLKINRPSLSGNWTPEQMRAGAVRIHNRFAALLTSVIESADWANYRQTKRPLEVGRPAWPDPGEYCDLVLQRRNGPAEVALEVKTRHIKIDDYRSPGEMLDSVLDHMGSQLHNLQKLASQSEALWCVALGLYRAPFQSAAIHYETPFSVVMIWGRSVGRDGPMSRAYFHSLAELDRAMCSSTEVALEVKTRHIKIDDFRSPGEMLDSVLDHMGSQLHNLQKLASQSEALWCVALGLYRAPFQSAAIHYETPFSVVMIWGRSVGRDGPMSRAYFHSLAELDRAMCSATEVAQFFELATHKQPSPRVDEPPDIEQLIARSHIPRKRKQTLLALYKWPNKPMALRTYLRQFATDTCSEYSLKHYTLDYVERGIVKGYKPGTSKHHLKVDEKALIDYLLTADHE